MRNFNIAHESHLRGLQCKTLIRIIVLARKSAGHSIQFGYAFLHLRAVALCGKQMLSLKSYLAKPIV